MATRKQKMKHQNGFGSIVKLSGKRRKPYTVRITTGWKDGKQVRKYMGYYTSEAEALIALAEYHKNGVDIDLTKLTLEEVFDRWLERVELRDVSISVMRMHNMTKSRLGALGKMPIKNIKTAQLQVWLDGIDLKPGSKGKLKSTLSQVFDYASQNDIVSKNYAKHLEIVGKIEKTGKVYTQDEIKFLWEHRDDEQARILLILLYTGMRIGEMLDINRASMFLDEQYIVGGLKTEAGRNRIIPLHDDIVPLVREQLGDNKWLLQNIRGGKMVYQVAKNRSYQYLEDHGMSHKFHDTRKTAVSIMHEAGIPMETIRIIVGHAGEGVTEKIYLHKHPQELVKAINKIVIKV